MIVVTSWVQGKCKASKLYLPKKNAEQKSGKKKKKQHSINTNRKKGGKKEDTSTRTQMHNLSVT
jgi:hypothetical protein